MQIKQPSVLTHHVFIHGVSYHRATSKWTATLYKDCKHHYLGLFETEQDAAIAYDHAVLMTFGSSDRLNFPVETAV
jgi:hypothetical protein